MCPKSDLRSSDQEASLNESLRQEWVLAASPGCLARHATWPIMWLPAPKQHPLSSRPIWTSNHTKPVLVVIAGPSTRVIHARFDRPLGSPNRAPLGLGETGAYALRLIVN